MLKKVLEAASNVERIRKERRTRAFTRGQFEDVK